MDILAKRYGKLPSELKSRSICDYQFDVLVATIAINEEIKISKKLKSKRKR